MKEFIEYIIKNLVDSPDSVEVQCTDAEQGVLVRLKVGSGDVGKVVGRKGATINALRTIATTAGARFKRRVRIELEE
ncbi:hypothetical protein ES708_20799 [subsurface metagenome]